MITIDRLLFWKLKVLQRKLKLNLPAFMITVNHFFEDSQRQQMLCFSNQHHKNILPITVYQIGRSAILVTL